MARTIRKNTKRAARIFEEATEASAYSLYHNFEAQPVDPKVAQEQLHMHSFCKLVDRGEGVYVVRVHSNLWYEVRSAAA